MNETQKLSTDERLDAIEFHLSDINRLLRAMIATHQKQPLSVKQLATIFNRDRSTIKSWIDHSHIKPVGESPAQGGHTSKYYLLSDIIKARSDTLKNHNKG
ncbi:MAG TPA: hypothetical protein PLE18_13845 [Candidatus Sumerlaeota bacterium]|nr:hypothetical protein [Candidatus Sumerlaeota bacterium]